MRAYLTIFTSCLMLFYSLALSADQESTLGIGQVAINLMEPVSIVADFVQTACLIIGTTFIFAAIIKYFEHKRSPLMVPISTVVFLILAGIALILLPFLSSFVENGVPYSLIK